MSSRISTNTNDRSRRLSFHSIFTSTPRQKIPQSGRHESLSAQLEDRPNDSYASTTEHLERQSSNSELEEVEDGQEISRFGSVSTSPGFQRGMSATTQAIALAGQVERYGDRFSPASVPSVVGVGDTGIEKGDPKAETQHLPLEHMAATQLQSDASKEQAKYSGGDVVVENKKQIHGSPETIGNNYERPSPKASYPDTPSLILEPPRISVNDGERMSAQASLLPAQHASTILVDTPVDEEGVFDQIWKRRSAGSNVALNTPRSSVARTASMGSQTEIGPHVLLFPRFRRGDGSRTSTRRSVGQDTVEAELRQGSFFEGPSSEEDEDGREEVPTIENTERVSFARPVVVEHDPTGQVDLREMLNTTPRSDAGPLEGSSKDTLGEMVGIQGVPEQSSESMSRATSRRANSETRRFSKRDGVIGMPTALREIEEDARENGQINEGPVGLCIWNGTPDPFAASPLISQSSGPLNGQTPKKRRVTFPPPLQIDISPEHRSLRETIVSTPYPLGHQKDAMGQRVALPEDRNAGTGRYMLTLIFYGDSIPTVKRIPYPVIGVKSPSRPGEASALDSFDDEQFFTIIRAEYSRVRGRLPRCMSARIVRGIRFVTYPSISQLVDRSFEPLSEVYGTNHRDGDFGETRTLSLYRKPRLGREQHDLVDWVARKDDSTETEIKSKDEIALEFHEGWAAGTIALAVAAVAFSSILASILYGCLYVGGNDEDHAGHGKGRANIETSLALGVLTLMVGWTCIVAWILLSWLVI